MTDRTTDTLSQLQEGRREVLITSVYAGPSIHDALFNAHNELKTRSLDGSAIVLTKCGDPSRWDLSLWVDDTPDNAEDPVDHLESPGSTMSTNPSVEIGEFPRDSYDETRGEALRRAVEYAHDSNGALDADGVATVAETFCRFLTGESNPRNILREEIDGETVQSILEERNRLQVQVRGQEETGLAGSSDHAAADDVVRVLEQITSNPDRPWIEVICNFDEVARTISGLEKHGYDYAETVTYPTSTGPKFMVLARRHYLSVRGPH